jgi:hypothetical protein
VIGRAYVEIPRTGGVELVPFDAKRPADSPGWGMLRAVKSGVFTSKQGERTTITAGVTGVAPCHWLAREYPRRSGCATSATPARPATTPAR